MKPCMASDQGRSAPCARTLRRVSANEAMHRIRPAVVATERVLASSVATARLDMAHGLIRPGRPEGSRAGRAPTYRGNVARRRIAAAWPRGWHPPALAPPHEREREAEGEPPPNARPKASPKREAEGEASPCESASVQTSKKPKKNPGRSPGRGSLLSAWWLTRRRRLQQRPGDRPARHTPSGRCRPGGSRT
jgi:hypothetical protein